MDVQEQVIGRDWKAMEDRVSRLVAEVNAVQAELIAARLERDNHKAKLEQLRRDFKLTRGMVRFHMNPKIDLTAMKDMAEAILEVLDGRE